MRRCVALAPGLPEVCRLGLATRGDSRLEVQDVLDAVGKGVNYLNWCGHPDGLSRAVAGLGSARDQVVVAWQIESRDAAEAEIELDAALRELKSERVEVVTLYYVESERDWRRIAGPNGALAALRAAQRAGKVGLVGLTSHQRRLAANWAESGPLDLLMLRYNAAHRGAETEVLPLAERLGVSFVAYTCLRWGALLQGTPTDPPGFSPPSASECYRFVLSEPRVGVALMAPDDRAELDHDLELLDDWRPLDGEALSAMQAHGDRVHEHAGEFW